MPNTVLHVYNISQFIQTSGADLAVKFGQPTPDQYSIAKLQLAG